ncbi:MAG: regulatory iron-sulfur-containing complex subunit RicT [Desulfovibrionaceae bacterium]
MNILGIRFRAHGQTYFFSTTETIEPNSMVVVDTEQGIGIGEVITIHGALPASIEQEEIRTVIRLAHDEDLRIAAENTTLATQALSFCQECIRTRKLDMKLVDVEVYYDRSKIIFYFTAPARIDFRELVKDLVREYRSRIELRQIGVRHETQMVGAVGNCGMVCCCRRFLRKFAPVTIRMAKEQNLFLNPAKISGICGRLLCCLSYEQDNYDAFHHNCPRLGKKYQTSQGSMKVLRANMFRNTLSVLNENNEELEFSLDDWQGMEPHRPESLPTSPQAQPSRIEKNPHGGDGLLVLTVTPETVDDPDLFDDMLPPPLNLETADGDETAPSDGSPVSKSKRKRKRKHRSEENGA